MARRLGRSSGDGRSCGLQRPESHVPLLDADRRTLPREERRCDPTARERSCARIAAGSDNSADWRCLQQGTATRVLGRLDPKKVPPVNAFLSGYGAGDNWYGKTIEATYAEFQRDRAGIPPKGRNTVPTPRDLALSPGNEFVRFAIAYALSVPFREGRKLRLQARSKPVRRP